MKIISNLQGYNIHTDNDITKSLSKLLKSLENNEEEKIIEFDSGFYFFTKLDEIYEDTSIYKTNKNEEKIKKYFSIIIKNTTNLTLNGNNTTFIFKDYSSYLLILNSKNIKITNISFRIESPNMYKIRLKSIKNKIVDFRLSNASEIFCKNGKYYFKSSTNKIDILDFKNQNIYTLKNYRQATLTKSKINPLIDSKEVFDYGNNILRVIYNKKVKFKINDEFYYIDKNKSVCGFLIDNSSNIEFKNIELNFSYSNLFTTKNSQNLYFKNINIEGLKGKRISIQENAFEVYNCRGNYVINNCKISGVCASLCKFYNPLFKAKFISSNKLLIINDKYNFNKSIFQDNDIIAISKNKNFGLNKFVSYIIKSIEKNNNYTILELQYSHDINKEVFLFNNSSIPSVFKFKHNKINRISEDALILQAKDIIIKNNEFIDTDKNFISIRQTYREEKPFSIFSSSKITINSNNFVRSTLKYIDISSNYKFFNKNYKDFPFVDVEKNIYNSERKKTKLKNIDNLKLYANAFDTLKERKKIQKQNRGKNEYINNKKFKT